MCNSRANHGARILSVRNRILWNVWILVNGLEPGRKTPWPNLGNYRCGTYWEKPGSTNEDCKVNPETPISVEARRQQTALSRSRLEGYSAPCRSTKWKTVQNLKANFCIHITLHLTWQPSLIFQLQGKKIINVLFIYFKLSETGKIGNLPLLENIYRIETLYSPGTKILVTA